MSMGPQAGKKPPRPRGGRGLLSRAGVPRPFTDEQPTTVPGLASDNPGTDHIQPLGNLVCCGYKPVRINSNDRHDMLKASDPFCELSPFANQSTTRRSTGTIVPLRRTRPHRPVLRRGSMCTFRSRATPPRVACGTTSRKQISPSWTWGSRGLRRRSHRRPLNGLTGHTLRDGRPKGRATTITRDRGRGLACQQARAARTAPQNQ